MPQPTRGDVHVDAVLTNISTRYMNKQDAFIASKVFPIVQVEKESDLYYVYTKEDWFRDEARIRGDAEESTGSGYNVGTTTYQVDVWSIHKMVGDRMRRNADTPLRPDQTATEFVSQRLLLRQEVAWASDYFTTSVWGTDVVGGTDFTKWSDYASSDPFEDIETGKEGILSTTGYEANTMVVGWTTWRKLKRHPDIRDQIKYTTAENVTRELMARLFEVDNLYICKAIKNTAVEGATASYAFVQGTNDAWLGYVNPAPALEAPSAGYIFGYTGVSAGMGEAVGISRIRMDTHKADRIEGEIGFDDKVVGTDLGYFFDEAVAA